jgi:DNA mismatch repair protein MutS
MLYDDYEAYLVKYKKEYGEKTIVLYECGSFFEIYDDGSGKTNMKDISEMLNIVVSRRNKAILEVSRSNCEMAGFPSHALKKFINILLSYNYTIVLVTQTTPPPNPKRAVTEIISPGTYVDVSHTDSNNLMNIYIEENNEISIGCSIIDLTTGKSFVYEASTYKKDKSYCFDELHRLISIYSPKEIEVMSSDSAADSAANSAATSAITLEKLQDYVDFGRAHLHDKIGLMNKDLHKLGYQKEVLSRVFKKTGLLSVFEFLNLERYPLATISFTRLIEFAYKHNESILQLLEPPALEEDTGFLILSYNAAQQLDIYNKGTGKYDSLLNILNNAKTAIGKRYFKYKFLHPMTDPQLIDSYYEKIDAMTGEECINIRASLSNVYDIERLYRKCTMGTIHPHEFYNIIKSLVALQDVVTSHYPANIISYSDTYFCRENLQLFNMDDIDATMFVKEVHAKLLSHQQPCVHALQDTLDVYTSYFKTFIRDFPDNTFKLEFSDKEGYIISTTQKRYQDIIVKPNLPISFAGVQLTKKDIVCKTMTNNMKLQHKLFDEYNNLIIATKQKMHRSAEKIYKNIIMEFAERFKDEIQHIVKAIEDVDYVSTCRYNADLYRLSRPTISPAQGSYVKTKGLRHLIIENLQKDIQYVANDIDVGTDDQKGILLYGINSSGKSSLMKSVGIAVIMAQAGMYVPCDSMEYAPYMKIFTRILSSDDIFRGQSTFTKEIIELRNILKRCDANSLIIGDELCSGTESQSALAIVSAGIFTLWRKGSSYLFATHLHDLIDVPEIKNIPTMKVYHLSVKCTEDSKKLVYDRKLKPGNGSSLYGIEVCRALGMDVEFVNIANEIRQRVSGVAGDIEVGKTSRYNTGVFVHTCFICKKTASEVHHINEQANADEKGYISTFHKNSLFNLVALCSKCHDDIHSKKIIVNGFVQTSDGYELDYVPDAGAKPVSDMSKDIVHIFSDNNILKTKKEKYDYIIKKYNITKYKINKILEVYKSMCL